MRLPCGKIRGRYIDGNKIAQLFSVSKVSINGRAVLQAPGVLSAIGYTPYNNNLRKHCYGP
jgi:hypothetical protein